jgi:hypothetical protein
MLNHRNNKNHGNMHACGKIISVESGKEGGNNKRLKSRNYSQELELNKLTKNAYKTHKKRSTSVDPGFSVDEILNLLPTI